MVLCHGLRAQLNVEMGWQVCSAFLGCFIFNLCSHPKLLIYSWAKNTLGLGGKTVLWLKDSVPNTGADASIFDSTFCWLRLPEEWILEPCFTPALLPMLGPVGRGQEDDGYSSRCITFTSPTTWWDKHSSKSGSTHKMALFPRESKVSFSASFRDQMIK